MDTNNSLRKRIHLVIVRYDLMEPIISGLKTVEARLTKVKTPAWNCEAGDTLIYKAKSCKEPFGVSTVIGTRKYSEVTPKDVHRMSVFYSAAMGIEQTHEFWDRSRSAKYATFIFFSRPLAYTLDIELPRSYGAGWMTLP